MHQLRAFKMRVREMGLKAHYAMPPIFRMLSIDRRAKRAQSMGWSKSAMVMSSTPGAGAMICRLAART